MNSCLQTAAPSYYPGQWGNSWSYEASGGHLYFNGQTTYYGGPYHSGDRIGVNVDLDLGKLNFYKNGVALGEVSSFHLKQTDVVKDDLWACVTLYSPGDSVSVIPASSPSPTTTSDDDDTKDTRGVKRQKVKKI